MFEQEVDVFLNAQNITRYLEEITPKIMDPGNIQLPSEGSGSIFFLTGANWTMFDRVFCLSFEYGGLFIILFILVELGGLMSFINLNNYVAKLTFKKKLT